MSPLVTVANGSRIYRPIDPLATVTGPLDPNIRVLPWIFDHEVVVRNKYHYRPIDLLHQAAPAAVHFVGFRGDEYRSAVRAFGLPDFVHRTWDTRAASEIAPFDTVVFAKYHDQPPSPYTYDDSNQPDDPAAMERIRS